MKIIDIKVILVITILICSTGIRADSGIESLSPELRGLLAEEMLAIQEGMQAILPAYVSGDLNEVAEIANKIKNSFILKQKISAEQKKEIATKLPKSFIKMDQKFHAYAGMLEHVSKERHTELVGFYYSKLTETCVACHAEYAKHKFPKLDTEAKENAHHH